jgi:hypothetical protein
MLQCQAGPAVMFVPAAVTLDAQKPIFQPATGKVVIKLLSDESRQLRIALGQ